MDINILERCLVLDYTYATFIAFYYSFIFIVLSYTYHGFNWAQQIKALPVQSYCKPVEGDRWWYCQALEAQGHW